MRSGAFEPVETGGTATVQEVAVTLQDFSTAARMVERAHEQASGPSIEDADVIVAGGRGLGTPEGFKLAEELAAALGGAVAATRAVVDAGGTRMRRRSGRPASRSRRSSTSRSGSPARSSTRSACRTPARSSRSTRIRTRRSSTSPTSAIVGDLNQIAPKLAELVRARKSLAWRREIRAADFPPPFSSAEVDRGADRRARRADRGRRPDRRRRPRRPRLRDPARPAARGRPGDGGAPRRGAGRARRQGQAARLAPALGRRHEPARGPAAVQGPARAARRASRPTARCRARASTC